ncbi:MAG TPA: protein kinase [Lacipirellulaceae bacterium]|nr:protein kinase [Lacipirellulaceae bacterium]
MTEQDIYVEAMNRQDAGDRRLFLDQACGKNSDLRARLDKLIQHSDRVGSFLEYPPEPLSMTAEAVIDADVIGRQIGPYGIQEQIGEGGMGVVFLAEQQRPVRRQVALKVIKPGMDTRQVIARFDAERQALALMDHSNIAKVLDAGATENGRPYFVMELVHGVPITDYCDQCNLTTRERLELYINVCQAVQHAHQKGVIHRDLKPTNILVAIQDGRPAPKIIDFGVAKALNQRLTEHTLATGFAQMIGTPLYMSPEQAELSPLGADTRSDIYSLGVLLYELLTGTTPFDKDRLQNAPYDELRRILREEEPPRPSTRISTLAADLATTVAEHRRTDARRLTQTVRGELDWIVMKCLEKDRTRRYETTDALAMDVGRYLDNEPIAALPPSNLYRFRKFVQRNKLIVAASSAVLGALILGLSASTWMFFKERAARERAVAAEMEQFRLREQAQLDERMIKAEAAKSQQMSAYMANLAQALAQGQPGNVEQVVSEILPPPPENDPRRADWLRFRGELWARIGRWKEAAADFSTLIELEPANHEYYHFLAPLLVQSGDLDAYRRHCARVVERFGKTNHPVVAERLVKDCLILPSSGADLEAVDAMADTAIAADPNHWGTAFFHFVKGFSEYRQGNFASAVQWLEKALAKRGEFESRDAQVYFVLAMAHHHLTQADEARTALAQGAALIETRPKPGSGGLGTDWNDWLIVHALQREATALIEGHSPVTPESGKEH